MNAQSKSAMVQLPDGRKVRISAKHEAWWDDDNASGYLDPSLLAADLEQPRRAMRQAKLDELRQSVRSSGVRQHLVITPMHLVPWAKVADVDKDKPFLIVSGHRRDRVAIEEGVGAVPVTNRIYPNARDHHLDRSLLNYGQDELSDLEQGYEILALWQEDEFTIEELCKHFSMETPQLYGRMNLTKLAPDIQLQLDPELPPKRRLGTTIGGVIGGIKAPTKLELEELIEQFSDTVEPESSTLGENLSDLDEMQLRFALQRLLLGVIKKKSLSSDRAMEFVREHTLNLEAYKNRSAGGHKTRRYEPSRRREVLTGLLKQIKGSVVMDWNKAELNRVFEYSSYEELAAYIAEVGSAAAFLAGLSDVLKSIQSKKHPTHPAIKALDAKKAVAAE